ncbi:MAG: hypothetical protein ABIJ96_12560 [Elusimicrobiota bacterium]
MPQSPRPILAHLAASSDKRDQFDQDRTLGRGLYNSPLSSLGLPERKDRKKPRPSRDELLDRAYKANRDIAAILRHIDYARALKIEECQPGARCQQVKLCSICGWVRERVFLTKYQARLAKMGSALHLVLTSYPVIRLTRSVLEDHFTRFREFREMPEFRQAVQGGVVNMHIIHGTEGWLPHFDALLDYGGGLSDNWFKKNWVRLGGAWNVEPETVTPGTQGQVLAYGARRQELPHDVRLLRQFHQATSGLTMIRSWGTMYPTHASNREDTARRKAAKRMGRRTPKPPWHPSGPIDPRGLS